MTLILHLTPHSSHIMSLRKLKRKRSKSAQKNLTRSFGTADPDQLLQIAQKHHHAGDLGQAEKAYRELLRAFPNHAAGHNDLGVLFHSLNQPQKALFHYKKAVSLKADYPQALINSGIILMDQGEFDEAVGLFQRVLDSAPTDIAALTNLGTAQHRQGKLSEALDSFRQVLALDPNDLYGLNNLALVLKDLGELEEAESIFSKVIRLQPSAEAHHGLGLIHRKQGKQNDAVQSFQKALEINPDGIDSWRNIGIIYTEKMEFEKAIDVYEKIINQKPDDTESLNKLGLLHQKCGKLEEAVSFFRKALQLQPDFLEARASFAETLEKYNKPEEAYQEVLNGLEIAPHDIELQTIAATCERRLGKQTEALERLSRLETSDLQPDLQRMLFFELGYLHNKSGNTEKAYSAFAAANRASQTINSTIDKDFFTRRIDLLQEEFQNITSLPEIAPELLGRAPVFLVGFPRSGTTLLDQILDSHPLVQTMEEKDILARLENKVAAPFENYLAAWQKLTKENITELQEEYYQGAAQYLTHEPGTILIDRNPYNTMRSSLIWRLFPDAKIILAIRHPLDVCLSCFMQNFKINVANANFFTIDDAAEFYRKIMQLWQLFEKTLPLNYHIVRYEDLVADLEGEARKVIDFLELEWDERSLAFHEHAQAKSRIKTASYHQVTQPIYKDARYRWLRYEKYVGAAREKLAPFITYFGYENV
ncbi:MAG: tetratricopeptide repeat protein [Desulfobulbaceae bacterium]|nr:tetratricopeptide repeat protein [Desulfobulbaceae bacterium]